jgi:hypothetical protein
LVIGQCTLIITLYSAVFSKEKEQKNIEKEVKKRFLQVVEALMFVLKQRMVNFILQRLKLCL